MKRIALALFALFVLLLVAPYSEAGVVKLVYKSSKPFVVPSAKVASYPARHPKKSSKALLKASGKSAKIAGKILY